MAEEIIVPHLGESVSDGTIGRWVKKIGDFVKIDEPLVELETDKVTLEINAPASGILKEMRVVTGDIVKIGQVIGVLEETSPLNGPSIPETQGIAEELSAAKRFTMTVQKITGMDKSKTDIQKSESPQQAKLESDRLSPAVRRMLSERGFAPGQVANATGRDGRLLKSDIMAVDQSEPMVLTTFVDDVRRTNPIEPSLSIPADVVVPAAEPMPTPAPAQAVPAWTATAKPEPTPTPTPTPEQAKSNLTPGSNTPILSGEDVPSSGRSLTGTDHLALPETRVKMTRLRSRIAQRLKEAQNTAALLTTFNDIDMSHVMATRDSYKDMFYNRFDIKLGFMSFFVKASVAALKEIPILNASIEGDDIIYKYHYDIGVAVSTEQGLVVPVVRDADQLSFADIEIAIAGLGQKAKNGKLSVDDLMGGTFTITNGGTFGSLMSTPILNPPQSAILGMHKIAARPVVIDGRIEARPMMYVALTYDHRIIDGRDAVTFLVRIKEYMEDPKRLLLGV